MRQLFHDGIILGEALQSGTDNRHQFQGRAHIRQGRAEMVPAAEN